MTDEARRQRKPEYMEAYRRLTNDLTRMFASERRALDVSPDYTRIMELVLAGRDTEAVELAQQFRDERGDRWRAEAAELGIIPDPGFIGSKEEWARPAASEDD